MNGEREVGTSWADFSGDHISRYRFVQSLLPPEAKVLDIGCGVGYGSALLSRTAQSVIGIDLRPHAIAFAEQHWARPNITFLVGDALDVESYPSEKFDVIVAFEIIEHLPDDARFIEIVATCLQPNGILCISAPNLEAMPHPEENPWHYRHYLPAQLRSLLKQHFDQVAEFTTVGSLVKPGSGGHSIVMVAYRHWPQRYTIGFVSQEYPSPPSRQYPPSGGIGTYTSLMAHALACRGHQVHVIARASDTDTHHTYLDDTVTVHRVANDAPLKNRLALKVLGNLAGLLPRCMALRKYMSQKMNVSFDLVETAEWSAETLLCAKLRRHVAVVTRLHTPTHVVREASGLKASWQVNWAEKLHAHLADAITAPSMAIADLCRRDWRLGRVDVIVNPINVNSETPSIRKTPSVLGYLPERFDTCKGFPVLVKALEQYLEEGQAGLSILLVGSDYTDVRMKRLLDRLEPWIAHEGDQSNRPIKVLARQHYSALQQLLDDLDILVLTSRYENAPYVVLEAMAKGKLVIAPRVGGLPEMIQDQVDGLLFKPGDAQDLALHLKWATEHPLEVYAIRQQAHASARERFSFERWIATYEVYYAHIIGKKRIGERRRRPFGWWLPINGQLLPSWVHQVKACWQRNRKKLKVSR